jgi:signal transduction histidine kinase
MDLFRRKSRGEAALREVCRSRPAFGRQLLFATLLFTGLFLADLYIIGQLAFGDLSHQVIDEAFRVSLDAVHPGAAPAAPVLPNEAPPAPAGEPECPVGDPVSTDIGVPCAAPPPSEEGGGVFRSLTFRLQRALTDTRGKVLWRDFRQWSLLSPGERPDRHLESGGHDRVREVWQVGGAVRPVIALTEQAAPDSQDVREVGIPEELIDQELHILQANLQRKVWIGAAAAVLILGIAFVYVLRLLRRTRLLEAQAQMDDRLAYVGGLAAGLAHEIRNPLNVLSMNLQMLEEDVVARLGEGGAEAHQYVATLQGEIRRLSNLVDNFLSYARPTQPHFESRDLNQVVGATCLLLRPQFEAHKVELRQDLAPFIPAVDLDEGQIRQALMNIFMNAVQILKPGGTVTVQTSVVPDGAVQVAVTDDGPGIAPGDRQRIFDVFYSNRPGGTGLGLAIAARIMEAHGGRIEVESGPGGRGARFVLRIPRRHAADGAPQPAGAVAVSRSS